MEKQRLGLLIAVIVIILGAFLVLQFNKEGVVGKAFTAPDEGTSTGPVARWSFEETTNVVEDTPGANDGTLNLGTNGNTDLTAARVPGIHEQAIHFDGVDDYVEIAGVPSASGATTGAGTIKPTDGDFTIGFWLKPTTIPPPPPPLINYRKILTLRDSTVDLFGVEFRSDSTIWFVYGNLPVASPITIDAWQHITLRKESSTITIFKDGISGAYRSDATSSLSYNNPSATKFFVGGYPDFPIFDGAIDELLFYDRALTPAEIAVLANKPPTVDFTATPSSTDNFVSFSATATDPESATPLTYTWNFDGEMSTTESTDQNPSYPFPAAGFYDATLTVTDPSGASTTITKQVAVGNQPPIVTVTSPTAGQIFRINTPVSFSATATDPDGDSAVITYQWNSGDRSGTPTGASATYTYTTAGEYIVTLTVTDEGGMSVTKEIPIIVGPLSPIAILTADPVTGEAPLTVTFSATGSRDPDGAGVAPSYSWDFGDSTTGTGEWISHAYQTPGTYTATLTATDADRLAAPATQQITVIAETLYLQTLVSSGRVAQWNLDDNVEDALTISDGTLTNFPDTGALYESGKIGKALRFDGVDDYVSITDHNALDFGTGDFTVSLWVKRSSTGTLFSKKSGDSDNALNLTITGEGKLLFGTGNMAANGFTALESTNAIAPGVWTHLLAQRKGNKLLLYLNGQKDKEVTGTVRDVTNDGVLILGADLQGTSATNHFSGLLDKIDIYNRALDETEIRQLQKLCFFTNTCWESAIPVQSIPLGRLPNDPFSGSLVSAANPVAEAPDVFQEPKAAFVTFRTDIPTTTETAQEFARFKHQGKNYRVLLNKNDPATGDVQLQVVDIAGETKGEVSLSAPDAPLFYAFTPQQDAVEGSPEFAYLYASGHYDQYKNLHLLTVISPLLNFDEYVTGTAFLPAGKEQKFLYAGREHTLMYTAGITGFVLTIDGVQYTMREGDHPFTAGATQGLHFVLQGEPTADYGIVTFDLLPESLAEAYEDSFTLSKKLTLRNSGNEAILQICPYDALRAPGTVAVCATDGKEVLTLIDGQAQQGSSIQNVDVRDVLFYYAKPASGEAKTVKAYHLFRVNTDPFEEGRFFRTHLAPDDSGSGKAMALASGNELYLLQLSPGKQDLLLADLQLKKVSGTSHPEYQAIGNNEQVTFNLPLNEQINIKLQPAVISPTETLRERYLITRATSTVARSVNLMQDLQVTIDTYGAATITDANTDVRSRSTPLDTVSLDQELDTASFSGTMKLEYALDRNSKIDLSLKQPKVLGQTIDSRLSGNNGDIVAFYHTFTGEGTVENPKFTKYADFYLYYDLTPGGTTTTRTHPATDAEFSLPLIRGNKLALGADGKVYRLFYQGTGITSGFQYDKLRLDDFTGTIFTPSLAGDVLTFILPSGKGLQLEFTSAGNEERVTFRSLEATAAAAALAKDVILMQDLQAMISTTQTVRLQQADAGKTVVGTLSFDKQQDDPLFKPIMKVRWSNGGASSVPQSINLPYGQPTILAMAGTPVSFNGKNSNSAAQLLLYYDNFASNTQKAAQAYVLYPLEIPAGSSSTTATATRPFTHEDFTLPLVQGKKIAVRLEEDYYLLSYDTSKSGFEFNGLRLETLGGTIISSTSVSTAGETTTVLFRLGDKSLEVVMDTVTGTTTLRYVPPGQAVTATSSGMNLYEQFSTMFTSNAPLTLTNADDSASSIGTLTLDTRDFLNEQNYLWLAYGAGLSTLLSYQIPTPLMDASGVPLSLQASGTYSSANVLAYYDQFSPGRKNAQVHLYFNLSTGEKIYPYSSTAFTKQMIEGKKLLIFLEGKYFTVDTAPGTGFAYERLQLKPWPISGSAATRVVQGDTVTFAATPTQHLQLVFDRTLQTVRFKAIAPLNEFRVIFQPAVEYVTRLPPYSPNTDQLLEVNGIEYRNCDDTPAAQGLANAVFLCTEGQADRQLFLNQPIEENGMLMSYEGVSGNVKTVTLRHILKTFAAPGDELVDFDWAALTANLTRSLHPLLKINGQYFKLGGSNTLQSFTLENQTHTLAMTLTKTTPGNEEGIISVNGELLRFRKQLDTTDRTISLGITYLSEKLVSVSGVRASVTGSPLSFISSKEKADVYIATASLQGSIYLVTIQSANGDQVLITRLPGGRGQQVLLPNGDVVRIDIKVNDPLGANVDVVVSTS